MILLRKEIHKVDTDQSFIVLTEKQIWNQKVGNYADNGNP